MAVLADETRSKSGLKRKHGTLGVGRTLRSLLQGAVLVNNFGVQCAVCSVQCAVCSVQGGGRFKWSRSGQAGTKNDPNSTVQKM